MDALVLLVKSLAIAVGAGVFYVCLERQEFMSVFVTKEGYIGFWVIVKRVGFVVDTAPSLTVFLPLGYIWDNRLGLFRR